MLIFLNIVLLCVATAATLAAFGGDTWDKEKKNEPFLHRVTLRGWISLGCLFAALILGVSKEIETKADAAKEKAADKAAADANERLLTAQLANTQQNLAEARSRLDKVLGVLATTQKTLGSVQSDLGTARSDLANANLASLETALGGAKDEIKEMWLFIPIKSPRTIDEIKQDFLPGLITPSCPLNSWYFYDDIIDFHVNEELQGDSDQERLRTREVLFKYSDEEPLSFDHLFPEDLHYGNGSTLFVKRVRFGKDDHVSVASYISDYRVGYNPFTLLAVGLVTCSTRMARRNAPDFDKALLMLIVDRNSNRSLSYTLQADKQDTTGPEVGGTFVRFRIVSPPRFMSVDLRNLGTAVDFAVAGGKVDLWNPKIIITNPRRPMGTPVN